MNSDRNCDGSRFQTPLVTVMNCSRGATWMSDPATEARTGFRSKYRTSLWLAEGVACRVCDGRLIVAVSVSSRSIDGVRVAAEREPVYVRAETDLEPEVDREKVTLCEGVTVDVGGAICEADEDSDAVDEPPDAVWVAVRDDEALPDDDAVMVFVDVSDGVPLMFRLPTNGEHWTPKIFPPQKALSREMHTPVSSS
jgi:hypothetical protein